MSYSEFVEQKVAVALNIANGAGGGGYTESATILAALSSGIAADIWPGGGIDSLRFPELWASYADLSFEPLKISIPLLTQKLREDGETAKAESIEAARSTMFGPGHEARVLTGSDVDMIEADVLNLGVIQDHRLIRRFSYAALFYKHIRCGLMHEFHITENATWIPMTSRDAPVSYSNRGSHTAPHTSKRLIHFTIPWLGAVIRSINVKLGDSGPTKSPRPKTWWING